MSDLFTAKQATGLMKAFNRGAEAAVVEELVANTLGDFVQQGVMLGTCHVDVPYHDAPNGGSGDRGLYRRGPPVLQ